MILTRPNSKYSIEGLAIIDDQASITIVAPFVANRLRIPDHELVSAVLSITTVEGTSAPEPCKIINELTVSSIDNETNISLPPTYIYKPLPNAIDEIPAPADVAEIAGLEDLASKFHNKNNEWRTIIIIGRDCIRAQTQEQTRFATDGTPMATKTPFGWTLIGEKNQPNDNTTLKLSEHQVLKTIHKPITVTLPLNPEREIDDAVVERYIYETNKETLRKAITGNDETRKDPDTEQEQTTVLATSSQPPIPNDHNLPTNTHYEHENTKDSYTPMQTGLKSCLKRTSRYQ